MKFVAGFCLGLVFAGSVVFAQSGLSTGLMDPVQQDLFRQQQMQFDAQRNILQGRDPLGGEQYSPARNPC